MGRYYNGDIEGKFWFAVQESTDAGFFGGESSEPNYLHYHFGSDDLPTIEEGIARCLVELGDNKAKFDAFFAEGGEGSRGYTHKQVAEHLGMNWGEQDKWDTSHAAHKLLEWYARLELGEKIKARVAETGECSFEAEL